ncbi:MAG: hypothetical protein ABW217_12925, partial [Polyangiaceae bacterium]
EAQGNQFARARVLASLHQARVRRHKRLVFIAPFGLMFAAASAWGMASGRVPELARQVAQAIGLMAPAHSSARPPEPAKATPSAPQPPPPAAPEAELAVPEATAEEAAPPTAARVSPRSVKPAPRPAPRPANDDLPSPDDPGHELYRAAHRAHFSERDPARALAGWDEYLAQARGGRFALEARYNRALCLVRLKRNEDARRALEPFARGDHGTYRRDDATRLLEALSRSAP